MIYFYNKFVLLLCIFFTCGLMLKATTAACASDISRKFVSDPQSTRIEPEITKVSASQMILALLQKNICRSGKYANAPGKYELAVKILNQIVQPGDTLNLEIYITGYGQITGAKFIFFPTSEDRK